MIRFSSAVTACTLSALASAVALVSSRECSATAIARCCSAIARGPLLVDARKVDGQLTLDRRLLDLAVLAQALLLDRPFGFDAPGVQLLFGMNPRKVDLAPRRDLRLLVVPARAGLFLRNLRPFLRPADRNFALLFEPCVLLLARDLQLALLRFQILELNRYLRFLLDLVAPLPSFLDLAGELREAGGIERVAGIEEVPIGLIEGRQRSGFELESAAGQRFVEQGLDPQNEIAAMLVQLFDAVLGGDRPERIHQTAFEKLAQRVGPGRPAPQGAGGERHGLRVGSYAHIELRRHVDPNPVPGDERVLLRPHPLQVGPCSC